MLYSTFFKSNLRQYICHNILLAGMVLGLCFLFAGAEPLQAANNKLRETSGDTIFGYLTAVERNNVVIINGYKYRLHEDADIRNRKGVSVPINKLSIPVYVDFICDPDTLVTKKVRPVIIDLEVTKRPL